MCILFFSLSLHMTQDDALQNDLFTAPGLVDEH